MNTLFNGMRRLCLLALLALLPLAVQANTSDAEQALRQYVVENTEKLSEKLDELRSQFAEQPDRFYQEMAKTLEPFVAFRRIAARVMGRYARQASPEQRDQFVERFKRSLFDTYVGALGEVEDFKVKIREVRINPRDSNRASVDMEIVASSGQRYQVSYSMYRPDENSQWLMENVIVEGVNLGLAFRDRFQQAIEKHRGNLQAVIDNWQSKLDSVGQKPQAQSPESEEK